MQTKTKTKTKMRKQPKERAPRWAPPDTSAVVVDITEVVRACEHVRELLVDAAEGVVALGKPCVYPGAEAAERDCPGSAPRVDFSHLIPLRISLFHSQSEAALRRPVLDAVARAFPLRERKDTDETVRQIRWAYFTAWEQARRVPEFIALESDLIELGIWQRASVNEPPDRWCSFCGRIESTWDATKQTCFGDALLRTTAGAATQATVV